MDFAKSYMAKFGFKEGEGLGKNNDGIATAIKANLKFDQAGFGEDVTAHSGNFWWERVFNEASGNLKVAKDKNNKISVEQIEADGVEITNKNYSLKKIKENKTELTYGSFLKSATLLANIGKEQEIVGHTTTDDIAIKPHRMLTDEELYNACEGRTAHKGARHGLTLNGKLARLAEQDKILLEKMKSGAAHEEIFNGDGFTPVVNKKKVKKKAKSADDLLAKPTTFVEKLETEKIVDDNDYLLKKSKKRDKKDQERAEMLIKEIRTIALTDKLGDEEMPEDFFSEKVQKKLAKAERKRILKSLDHKQLSDIVDNKLHEEVAKNKKKSKKRKHIEENTEIIEQEDPEVIKRVTKIKRKLQSSGDEDNEDNDLDIIDKLNVDTNATLSKNKERKRLGKSSKKQKKRYIGELADQLSTSSITEMS